MLRRRARAMLTIVVRSKRDADALRAALVKFYEGWNVEVRTLKGARSSERALEALEELMREPRFCVLLLGREDTELARELERVLPPLFVVHVVPRQRLRNARVEQIHHEISRALSKIRLRISWREESSCYVLLDREGAPLGLEPNPAYDAFLGLGREFIERLSEVLGRRVGFCPLLVRKMGGVHDVFSGPNKLASLVIPDEGVTPQVLERLDVEPVDVNLDAMVRENKVALEQLEGASTSMLKKLEDEVDSVVVPWSGGKDSTAALIMALKVFSRRKVVAVYVDTGVEFPETREYVEKVSKRLGVRLHVVEAGIKEKLDGGAPLPTHENRWCTGLKLEALRKAFDEVSSGRTLVVVGDRDAESERRGLRPPLRTEEGRLVAAPLKFWSAAHVQLYLLAHGIELHPLYLRGFYRLGCYVCPALRSWELYVLSKSPTYYKLLKCKHFRRFIWLRVFRSRCAQSSRAIM